MKFWPVLGIRFYALLFTLLISHSSLLQADEVTDEQRQRVQELYIAYYGRPADPEGLEYWAQKLADNRGELYGIINAFGDSEEYQNRFGEMLHSELVRNIFQFIFDRDPDTVGGAFYIGRLDHSESTLAEIALQILDGATGDDQIIIYNKRVVATSFTESVRTTGYVYGPEQTDDAVALLDSVDETAGSVLSVQEQIEELTGQNQESDPGQAPDTSQDVSNVAPVASAGSDQDVTLDAGTVTLDASGSHDSDGSVTGYLWEQTSGTRVTLSGVTEQKPTFAVPDVVETLIFQVTVTDNSGATDKDSVNIIITSNTEATLDAPVLENAVSITREDSVDVEITGEAGADIIIGGEPVGKMTAGGQGAFSLDTTGEDGTKTFVVILQTASGHKSHTLTIEIVRDTTPPNTNATVDQLSTDDTTPALSGKLPSGDDDQDTSQYSVSISINGQQYDAINEGEGNWSVADNTITALDEGFTDVTVITTDAAGNQSQTVVKNSLEINNSAFFIDSAVEGVWYSSGSYSGYTDENGMFKYEAGNDVSFYLGSEDSGVPLGKAAVKTDPHNEQRKIVTLFDLGGSQDANHPRVLNMGRLLQSLDSDNDTSNGIEIDQRTKESIELLALKNRINFDDNTEDFAASNDIYNLFNDLAKHFGEHRGLIEAVDAKAHLEAVRDNRLPTRVLSSVVLRGEVKEPVILKGNFKSIDGPVQGLEYRSGNQYGRTTVDGEFHYEEGKQVKFFIYQLELGVTTAGGVITPADLVPSTSFNHPKPRNIIRLLRAFDAVASDGKITLDQAVRDALEKYRSQIDLNLPDGKADTELGISKGEDEFGAQFDDFEIGKDILDEITTLRAGS